MANPTQTIYVDGIPIKMVVSPRSKKISLSVRGSTIKLTRPKWVSKKVAENFAKTKSKWVKEHYRELALIQTGTTIGEVNILIQKSHKNYFEWDKLNLTIYATNSNDQTSLLELLEDAFREKARDRIYESLDIWTEKMNLEPEKIRISKSRSRWGSCSQAGTLSFSLFSAQLPHDLLQYLVIHEMAHLQQPNHSADFWRIVEQYCTNYKQKRKSLKSYHLDFL